MTLLYALVGALAAIAVALVAAVILLARYARVLRDGLEGLAQAVDDALEDMDATVSAMREDAIALDEALSELIADVEAIKRNPLGPPVDAEEDADAGLSD